MKIWVIGRNYPAPHNQMKGSFELEQAKMMAKRKELNVSYLAASLHPVKKIKKSGFQKWSEDDLDVFSYSQFFPPRIYPIYFGKVRNKIWKNFLKKVQNQTGLPDVIHLHYPVMMMLADVLEDYKNKGVKIVVTEHWTKVLLKKLDSYEIRQLKKYCDFVDSFICVGEPLRKAVSELTLSRKNMIVIPNVVNKCFKPSFVEHDGFRFIAVGRLVKQKQFDLIVRAFSDVFKVLDNITLTIVGDGEEKENIKKIVKELNLDDKVILTGTLSREDTAQIVSESDCLICYSTFETFGVPVIEAWACGLPTISTTSCAVLDKMNERLGIEISPDDIDNLKSAMTYIYNHYDEYDKSIIVNYTLTHFSEEIIGNQLLELYHH